MFRTTFPYKYLSKTITSLALFIVHHTAEALHDTTRIKRNSNLIILYNRKAVFTHRRI